MRWLAPLVATSCASLAEVQSEWAQYLDGLPGCKLDKECVLIELECPLGCAAAVPRSRQAEAEARAAELVDAYTGLLRPCTTECTGEAVAFCSASSGCELGEPVTLPLE